MDFIRKYSWVPGVAFTVLVVGLLLYLHLSDAEHTPKPRQWTGEKTLFVCEAPEWVSENLSEALELIRPWSQYIAIVNVKGPCSSVEGVGPVRAEFM